ncbi:cobalt-precorrin-6A reductase [Rhodobacter sp. NSM]|uniref:cobalt-precorrin-6A reductase n=1 Tax=Rhodobacter sp. NSM TaxID=3457501 RepID=UPI003FD0A6A7
MRILLLGGTTEASRMAALLAGEGLEAVFSYAGRTATPIAQPLPVRMGGFGGAEGLADYLRQEGISHVVDATHPFAAQMSRNAVEACALTGIPLVALERAPWVPGKGDRWTRVGTIAAAAEALPEAEARVFLAIGRMHLEAFAGRPQHHYLLRLVDPPEALPLPRAEVVIARGPFDLDGDLSLMREQETEIVVAKNAGGEGARAKLDAARMLGLPVILIDRPAIPDRPRAETPEAVMGWLGHGADLGV